MATKQVNKSRRVILGSTVGLGALGAALPSSWTKPIVNAVVLPVHAMTSPIYSFSVEKTQTGGPNPAMLEGDVIEYSIVVTNTGTASLTNVVATDTMPDGSVVVLSNPSESLTADDVLDVNETWTYMTTYTVTLADISAGTDLTNSVSVVTDEAPDPQDDTVDTPIAVECPTIVVGAVTQSSGGSAGLCSLTFEFFSSMTTPLTITSITNTALTTTSEVTYDEALPVDVTDSIGTSVTWTGGLLDVNCAVDFTLIADDVTFSVEATCEGGVGPVIVDFTLSEIAAML